MIGESLLPQAATSQISTTSIVEFTKWKELQDEKETA